MKENIKSNKIKQQILSILLDGNQMTVASLSKLIQRSEKDIRNKIDEINVILEQDNLGVIEKTPGRGVKLSVKKDCLTQIQQIYGNYEVIDTINGEYRLYQYLRILLSRKNKITLSELSEQVYDSISVCKKHLETCGQWLNMFSIKVQIKRNYGIELIGTEESFRLAIKHLIINDEQNSIDDNIKFFAPGINLYQLKNCVEKAEEHWHLNFTDESFNSILIFAALAITRGENRYLNLNKDEIDTVVKYSEYSLSKALFEMVHKSFLIPVCENEIVFMAIQLLCSHILQEGENSFNHGAADYDNKIKEFVKRIISVVSDITNVDLTADSDLYYGLLNHIRPAIFRMKFEKHSTAKLINFIQDEFKNTYRVSWALSALFEEYYGIQISDTELSYITLYIQSALDRQKKPLRIILITELGMGLNQMFCNKIRLSISNVSKIKIVSLHDYKIGDFDGFDLIVTTSKLNFTDNRIVEVESLLSNYGIEKIKQKIQQMDKALELKSIHFDVSCHNLFDPILIFNEEKIKNKEELIRKMSNKLLENGYVIDKYYESVLKREKTVSTCIGDGVAIPHGNSAFVNQSKVVIAILDNPIEWSSNEFVKVVFLLGLRITTKIEAEQTQLFYKSFLNMIDSDKNVDKICNMSPNELYKVLVR